MNSQWTNYAQWATLADFQNMMKDEGAQEPHEKSRPFSHGIQAGDIQRNLGSYKVVVPGGKLIDPNQFSNFMFRLQHILTYLGRRSKGRSQRKIFVNSVSSLITGQSSYGF